MKGWKYLVLVLVLIAIIPFVYASPPSENIYNQNYSFVCMYNANGKGIYNWSGNNDTLNHLMKFKDIWVSNSEYPLNSTWVDNLHSGGGRSRTLIFYQFFPALHFIGSPENPSATEGWKSDFLGVPDSSKKAYHLVHPRDNVSYDNFTEGRWCSTCRWADYFINYGNESADENLTNVYYDVKRADFDYDGIFFDLVGSYFTNKGEIKDNNDPSKLWNPITRYNWNVYKNTREDPSATYDENGRTFLQKLRSKNNDSDAFPIWANQAYHSNFSGHQNEYYKVINADIAESVFTSWSNSDGWVNGVSVMVDGVWYNNSCPVETKIVPFATGKDSLYPLIQQSMYASSNYGNSVSGKIFNTLRPYYDPISGGYNAIVDREAIYYSYGTGKVMRLSAYGRDVFDTVYNKTRMSGAPTYTGLPQLPYHKWAKDDIYFLDLGDYEPSGYETYDLGGGKEARVRWLTKGIVIVNSADPPQDICIDFSNYDVPYFKNQSWGVRWHYKNFENQYQVVSNTEFCVPAAYRPIENAYKNSARIFSYIDASSQLLDPECGPYVAYYPFEDNSTDDVAGGNDGTNHGATFVAGKYKEGLEFDGDGDYVDVSDSSDLDITDEISISMWVKGDASDNPSASYAIGKTNAYGIQVSTTSGPNVIFRIRKSDNSGWNNLYTGEDVLNATWNHVLATYDGDKMRVYVNDDLVSTSSSIGDTIFASASNLRLGTYTPAFGNFNGTLDEVQVWDCVS